MIRRRRRADFFQPGRRQLQGKAGDLSEICLRRDRVGPAVPGKDRRAHLLFLGPPRAHGNPFRWSFRLFHL